MKMQEAIKAWEELEIKDDFMFARVMRDKRPDYINAEDEEVREFLKYVNGEKSDNPFVKEIEDKVAQVKKNEEWRLEYVTLLMRDQENQEIGIEIGKELGREMKIA